MSTTRSSASARTAPTRPKRWSPTCSRSPPASVPTALFTANNRNTVGALKALRATGDDAALVGFDDFELADLLGASVVRFESAALGRQASALAFGRLDGNDGPPETIVVPTELVARGSGGAAGMKPLRLPPNQLHRFYLGGPRIAALRGTSLEDDHTPEEWVGSANTSFGETEEGLSRLEDGTFVRDAINDDPEAFLGPEHVARYGSDPALLVKLLDAGERLPVHYHPGRAFAQQHLNSTHGKTEAWLIVEADPGAEVRVGFKAEPDPETLADWLRTQDSEAMLDALHPLSVKAGDAVFVPAGTAHAIGAGILMVELQEPTDFSILLEHDPFGVTDEAGATLGLGWDKAIQALDRRATDAPEPHAARRSGRVLPRRARQRTRHPRPGLQHPGGPRRERCGGRRGSVAR
jgi:mannose-6-phosphate isomerase